MSLLHGVHLAILCLAPYTEIGRYHISCILALYLNRRPQGVGGTGLHVVLNTDILHRIVGRKVLGIGGQIEDYGNGISFVHDIPRLVRRGGEYGVLADVSLCVVVCIGYNVLQQYIGFCKICSLGVGIYHHESACHRPTFDGTTQSVVACQPRLDRPNTMLQ